MYQFLPVGEDNVRATDYLYRLPEAHVSVLDSIGHRRYGMVSRLYASS